MRATNPHLTAMGIPRNIKGILIGILGDPYFGGPWILGNLLEYLWEYLEIRNFEGHQPLPDSHGNTWESIGISMGIPRDP